MGKKKQLRCCKICGNQVKNGKGLQCCGTCGCWYHFKCLCYDKKKIKAIVKGIERIECPCPDCTMMPPGAMKSPCGGNDTKCGSIIRQFSADCPDMFNPARTGETPCQMLMDSYGQLRQPSALATPMQCEQLPICPPETCQEYKDLANVIQPQNNNYQQYQPQQFQPNQMYAPPQQPMYYPPPAPMNMQSSQQLTAPCPPNPCPPIPCPPNPCCPDPCCPDPCLPQTCPPCPTGCPYSHCVPCGKNCCKECKKKKKECEKKKKLLLKLCKPPKLRDKTGACVNCKQTHQSPSLATCRPLTVCSSMEKLVGFQNKLGSKTLCGTENLHNINNPPATIDQSDQVKGLIKLICKEVVSRGTDPENKSAVCSHKICSHNYNYSDDTDFVHTQPSSFSERGNLENEIEAANQRALSLNTVEKMCKTVGKLTCQINDLMDKLKDTITYPEPAVKNKSHDNYGCANTHNTYKKVNNEKLRRSMNQCF